MGAIIKFFYYFVGLALYCVLLFRELCEDCIPSFKECTIRFLRICKHLEFNHTCIETPSDISSKLCDTHRHYICLSRDNWDIPRKDSKNLTQLALLQAYRQRPRGNPSLLQTAITLTFTYLST